MAYDWRTAECELSSGYDHSRPAAARLWALWSGGKDYNLADRAFGDQVRERFPQISSIARHRLAFRSRVVRVLAGEYDIDQFLVVGADMPMHDEVHRVAWSVRAGVRVVYADSDELVMAYAAALFGGESARGCGFVRAGLNHPRAVLEGAAATLDLSRPVAVLLINSLDLLSDPVAVAALAAFRSGLPTGSYIALSHLTAEHDRRMVALGHMCADMAPGPLGIRSPAELEAFCTGMVMVPPGLVPAPMWRPEPSPWPFPAEVDLWCGVGALP